MHGTRTDASPAVGHGAEAVSYVATDDGRRVELVKKLAAAAIALTMLCGTAACSGGGGGGSDGGGGDASVCATDQSTVKVAAEAYHAENGSWPKDWAALESGGFVGSAPLDYTVDGTDGTPMLTAQGKSDC